MSSCFVTPWTVARQAPLFMELSRHTDTGVGNRSLLQGIFPTQGSNWVPSLQVGPLLSEPPGEPLVGTDPTYSS